MSTFNLDDAEVGPELNPLGYSPGDYPHLSVMLEHIMSNKPVTEIDISKMAVNGKIKQDDMKSYLNHNSNSSSALKEILKTPLHYMFYMNSQDADPPETYFELGTFAHQAFLEPELFNKVIIEPDCSLSTTEGVGNMIKFYENLYAQEYPHVYLDHLQAAKELVVEQNLSLDKIDGKRAYYKCLKKMSGFTCVQKSHKDIIDVLKRHYYAYGGGIIPMILRGAKSECSFYGQDPETGLGVKIRPDAFNIAENIGVDAIISFKTTSAQDVRKFIYDTAKYQYELSEGMYQEVASHITGRKFNATIMIMLQTVPPYLPAVFYWSPDDLQNGKYKYRTALQTVVECEAKKYYPGYDALAESGNYGIIEMRQPDWAQKELAPVDVEN